MNEYSLKSFDINTMRTYSIVCIIDKRRLGKSFLIKDLLYNKRDKIYPGMIISPGCDKLFYEKFIPKKFVHTEYTEEFDKLLDNLLKNQLEKRRQNIGTEISSFVVIDNNIEIIAKVNKINHDLFLNSKHYNTMVLFTMQCVYTLKPTTKVCIDYIFISKNNNREEIKKFYKYYATMFSSLNDFEFILNKYTDNYNFLVIDLVTSSNKIEETVFFYKASSHDCFQMK